MDKSGWGLLGETDDARASSYLASFYLPTTAESTQSHLAAMSHAMQARVVNPTALQALGLIAGEAKRECYVMAAGDALWIIVMDLTFSLAAAPLLEKPRGVAPPYVQRPVSLPPYLAVTGRSRPKHALSDACRDALKRKVDASLT